MYHVVVEDHAGIKKCLHWKLLRPYVFWSRLFYLDDQGTRDVPPILEAPVDWYLPPIGTQPLSLENASGLDLHTVYISEGSDEDDLPVSDNSLPPEASKQSSEDVPLAETMDNRYRHCIWATKDNRLLNTLNMLSNFFLLSLWYNVYTITPCVIFCYAESCI